MYGLLSEQDNTRQMCEAKANKTTLDKAKTWWKNWLSNPSTIQRFKDTHKELNDERVKKSFEKYNQIIDKITIRYDYYGDEKGEFMSVIPTEKFVIYVNCSAIKDMDEHEIVSTFVHEIQHWIWNKAKNTLIPLGKALDDFGIDYSGLDPMTGEGLELNQENVDKSYNKLKAEGFSDDLLKYYMKGLNWYYKEGPTIYVNDHDELSSYIYDLRAFIGKDANQQITVDDVKKVIEKDKAYPYHFMLFVLKSGKSMAETLNNVNSYAVNKNPNQPKIG